MDQFWLPLILGIVLGWLFEWLVDWLYWRPQVSALRQQNADLRRCLAAAEADLAERTTLAESPPTARVVPATTAATDVSDVSMDRQIDQADDSAAIRVQAGAPGAAPFEGR